MEASNNHPHVRMIVPGGDVSFDGERAIVCWPGFVSFPCALSRLGGLLAEKLVGSHRTSESQVFGKRASFAKCAFAAYLAPAITGLRRTPTRSHPQLGAQVRCKLSLHLDFASRAVSSVFLFRPNFAHVPGAPARSLLGRSGATSHPRARNQARPRHPRCAPSSRP
jgi:hypothetical protein